MLNGDVSCGTILGRWHRVGVSFLLAGLVSHLPASRELTLAGGFSIFATIRTTLTSSGHKQLNMKKIPILLIGVCLVAFGNAGHAGGLVPGLVGEYFALGGAVEDFPKIEADKKPTLKRVDKTINFRSTGPTFPDTKLDNHFAIRWTGIIKIPQDGKYTFFLESDDGSRLLIDGKIVVDNGGLHDMQEQSDSVELKAGEHEIRIDYFENENDGGAGCVLCWKSKDQARAVVPASVLFHKAD